MKKSFTSSFLLMTLLWGATSGPSAPEVGSFQPVDVDQLVNLSTGDFSYNIPIIHLPGPGGGYQMSLFYQAGITTNQEASWVGLGWNLQAGAITRSIVGFPDDFNGVEVKQQSTDSDISANFSVDLLDQAASFSTSYSFKQGGLSSTSLALAGMPISRLGVRRNSMTHVSSVNMSTRKDIAYDKRWGQIGSPLDGDAWGFSLSRGTNLNLISETIAQYVPSFGWHEPDPGVGSVSLNTAGSFRLASQDRSAYGALYSKNIPSNNDEVAGDFVIESDLKMAKERITTNIENAWDAMMYAMDFTEDPIPNEGMIHLASDIYNINAQGLNGSMRVTHDNGLTIRGRKNIEKSLNLNFSVGTSANLESSIEDIISALSANPSISASGVYSTSDYLGEESGESRFELVGTRHNGGYKIDHQTENNVDGPIENFTITNPQGVKYEFSDRVTNTLQKSWSSSLPPGKQKKVELDFSELTFSGYLASISENSIESPYVYTWKLSRIEYPTGHAVEFIYSAPENINWRTPFEGTGPVAAITANSRSQVAYGKKQINYLKSVKTDTHMALFFLEDRDDGYSIKDEDSNNPLNCGFRSGGMDTSNPLKKLAEVVIISTNSLDPDTVANLKNKTNWDSLSNEEKKCVIKRIKFNYDYSLAEGTPNNFAGDGKLTLKGIDIYGKTGVGFHMDYDFTYANNPHWTRERFDRWGFYSLDSLERWKVADTSSIVNPSPGPAQLLSCNAAAWSLTDIKLPSGGHIQVEYGNDRYNWAGNNKLISTNGVNGGGIRVESLFLYSDAGDTLGGTKYQYDDGATSSEPLAYTVLHTADYEYIQYMGEDYGEISVSQNQNGTFYQPGPTVMYGKVTEFPLEAGEGYVEHVYNTPEHIFHELVGDDPDDMIESIVPLILKPFRHIGLIPYGRGACIKVFGVKICALGKRPTALPHTFGPPPIYVPTFGFSWFLPPNNIPITVGPSKKVAQAIFGPFGDLTHESLSIDWDVSESKFKYRYSDYSSRLGQPISESTFDYESNLLKNTSYEYYEPMSGEGVPEISNNYFDLKTTQNSNPTSSYQISANKKGYLIGLDLSIAWPLDYRTMSVNGQLYFDRNINYETNYAYYPYNLKRTETTLFNEAGLDSNKIWTEYNAYEPITNQAILTVNNHPEKPEVDTYSLSVPAYRKYPWLKTKYNILEGEYQMVKGVVLADHTVKPLFSTINAWHEFLVSPTDTLPGVSKEYIWKGGVEDVVVYKDRPSAAWLLMNETLQINEYGLPELEVDGLGTRSSVLYDDDRVTMVAVNAQLEELVYEPFSDSDSISSRAQGYYYDSDGTYSSIQCPGGNNYIDLLLSSASGPNTITLSVKISGVTIRTLEVEVTNRWQFVRFAYMSSATGTLEIEANGEAFKLDEVRMYPTDALVTNFIYDESTLQLLGIEDSNGQITNYRYDDFDRLTLIRNSRDQLLKRIYYDKRNISFSQSQ